MGFGRQLGRGICWFEQRLFAESVGVLFVVLLARGVFSRWGLMPLLIALALAMLLASRLWKIAERFTSRRVNQPEEKTEYFQLELILLCAVFLLFQLTGSVESPLYPILFLVLAAVGGFDASIFNRLMLVLVAEGFELLAWLSLGKATIALLAVHLVSIAGFPFVLGALEWAWTISRRKKQAVEFKDWVDQKKREADEYRFSGMTSVSTEISLEKRREDLQLSSVEQLGIGVENMLKVLEASQRPHTVAVYWLSVDERTVTLMGAFTASDLMLRETVEAGEGVIGSILKGKDAVLLNNVRKSYGGFKYYREAVPLKAFIGVPLLEEANKPLEYQTPRGVLLADRRVDVPFGDDDKNLLQVAAQEILRIWKTERQLNRMDRIRNEAEGLYNTTQGLIKAVTLQEVVDEVAGYLRKIYKGADFAAVVLEEEIGHSLVIQAVNASGTFEGWQKEYLNREISWGNHLCCLVIRRGIILPEPAFDKRTRSQRKVFGEKVDPPGLKSVKVAPLKLASSEEDKSIGALVVGSTRPSFFPERGGRVEDVKRTLETISNIAAISIQNAKRYEQLEQLATTDGLTGLHNHRRFQEIIEELVTEAIRYQRPLSLILTDIDHFKNVNDTYGHPVGDQVLKRVARVINELARAADRVCRYGGEEFAVIMPETDKIGGRLLAERFRKEIKSQEFQADGKNFSVCLSLGVCTLPEYARHKQELIDRADRALYHAKKNGRDQTVHYMDIGPAFGSEGSG